MELSADVSTTSLSFGVVGSGVGSGSGSGVVVGLVSGVVEAGGVVVFELSLLLVLFELVVVFVVGSSGVSGVTVVFVGG